MDKEKNPEEKDTNFICGWCNTEKMIKEKFGYFSRDRTSSTSKPLVKKKSKYGYFSRSRVFISRRKIKEGSDNE